MTTPGIQRKKGIIEHGKRDSTSPFSRKSKVPPTSISNAVKMKEGVSVSVPIKRGMAYTDVSGMIVAEIYFATDDDRVNTPDDIIALDNLITDVKDRLNDGFRLSLLCTGGADYRASFEHNMDLGKRRAISVRDYIGSRVTHKEFRIRYFSIGESKALQPKNGKNPSLLDIMKDRKVVVSVDINGFLPPVTLAVTGNWILGIDIERNEINNGGRVVALPGSIEAKSGEEEYEYWKTGRTKLNKGKEQDPLLPVVVIKTNYYVKKINNIDEAFVECVAIHQMTNRVLFTAFARTDANNKINETYSYNPRNLRVMRKVYEGDKLAEGRESKDRLLKGGEVNMRGLYLFDPIYTQLKGSFRTITKRAEAILSK